MFIMDVSQWLWSVLWSLWSSHRSPFVTSRKEGTLNSLSEQRFTSRWAAETMQDSFAFLTLGVVPGSDTLSMVPRSGVRPLYANSEGKYLSRSMRFSNNKISDLLGLEFALSHFLAQPSLLGWLDLSFNKITSIDPVLGELHELRVLYLHGNSIWILSKVDRLGELQHLHTITLHGNPVESNKGYRNHVISALPHLKTMDFAAVTQEERVLANIWRHCTNRSKNIKERPQ